MFEQTVEALKKRGFEVEAAATRQEALALIRFFFLCVYYTKHLAFAPVPNADFTAAKPPLWFEKVNMVFGNV